MRIRAFTRCHHGASAATSGDRRQRVDDETKRACRFVSDNFHRADFALDTFEHRSKATQQVLSGLRQRHTACRAIEKPHAKLLLRRPCRLAEPPASKFRDALLLWAATAAKALS